MSTTEIKTEINKILDAVTETTLESVLNYLKSIVNVEKDIVLLSKNIRKILEEDKELLEKLTQ